MSAKDTDSCPNCLERDIAPAIIRRRGQRTRYGYECPRCSQQWITERIDSAYADHQEAAWPPHPAPHATTTACSAPSTTPATPKRKEMAA
ncbi:hypothetical protein ABZY44_21885 [Streptomyces sp. NPDC006544]|uniref:hypothetical protein n=1 Tax=Streptomyces sp. NPDC006544 TaxID=3154583 RepID=UPI0033A32F2A